MNQQHPRASCAAILRSSCHFLTYFILTFAHFSHCLNPKIITLDVRFWVP
uniref:Uncharacterized protein n=1 Tax=Physcomitrium patens TaxID=3218 RepID=A0A2K1ITK6_PHYPA|nr:hypothetical protein PHYPA_024555 [Physcomitrium patens]